MQPAPILIFVHPADNGPVTFRTDSDGAKTAKAAAMTLAAGPFGLLAGISTRGLRAECEACGEVFARADFSAVLETKMAALVDSGALVMRSYTPPPIAAYDPAETHASPNTGVAEHAKAENARYDAVIRSLFVTVFALGGLGVCATNPSYHNAAGFAADTVLVAIAASSAYWLCGSIRVLAKAEKTKFDAKETGPKA